MVTVVKFGGSLLTSANDYLLAAKRVAELREQKDVVVVVSAMKGVTSKLIKLIFSNDLRNGLVKVFSEHLDILRAIRMPSESSLKQVKSLMEEVLKVLESPEISTEAIKDEVISLGERLSIILFKEALLKEGINAIALSGGEAGIFTDNNHGNAVPLFDECLKTIPSSINPIIEVGAIPVVAGFTGITKDGRITTLGRGGSDLTASLIASALKAKEILLFTNVPGIMTCDPSLLKDAKTLPKVSLEEANIMAKLRVKKFHPLTFYPLLQYKSSKMRVFIGKLNGVGTHVVKGKVPPPIKVVSKLGKDIVVVGHRAEVIEEFIKEVRSVNVARISKFENYVVLSCDISLNGNRLLKLIHDAILRMLEA